MKRLDLIRQIEDEGAVFVRNGHDHDWYRNVITGAYATGAAASRNQREYGTWHHSQAFCTSGAVISRQSWKARRVQLNARIPVQGLRPLSAGGDPDSPLTFSVAAYITVIQFERG